MALGARIVSLLIVFLLAATTVQAQHRWNAKEQHWYKDWAWWVGEFVIVGAFVADAHSTVLVRDRCPGCRETNPFLGPHPTNRGIIVMSSLGFGIQTLFHIGAWETCPDTNREYKSYRIACDAIIPGITAAFKVSAAVKNYHLASQFQSATIQSLSVPALARARSLSDPRAESRLASWSATRYGDKPFFLPKQFSGCGHSLTLCTPIPTATETKVDLRSLQLR